MTISCQYCGRPSHDLTIDHIVPRSRGGQHVWENLTSACKRCNHRKGGKSLAEAKMTLRQHHSNPNRSPYAIHRRLGDGFTEAWSKFLPGLELDRFDGSESLYQMIAD
ncbi:MAG: HNH endonuclease [Thermomicrobiales bacterium]